MNDLSAFAAPATAEAQTPGPQAEATPGLPEKAPLDFAGSMPGPQENPETRNPELFARMKAIRDAKANPSGKYDPTKSIAKVNYSHDAMIDLIIANPGVDQGDLAKAFGYTEGWVSQVMSSDAFKERLASRKKELVDPSIVASIEERFEAVANLSLERLKEKLERAAAPSMETIMAGATLASRALGYGARPDPRNVQVAVQTIIHVPAKATDKDDWLAGRTVAVQG